MYQCSVVLCCVEVDRIGSDRTDRCQTSNMFQQFSSTFCADCNAADGGSMVVQFEYTQWRVEVATVEYQVFQEFSGMSCTQCKSFELVTTLLTTHGHR